MADPTAARRFYNAAFRLGPELGLRASEKARRAGFRGFTLSLTVSQPATVSHLIGAALNAGATPLKPAAKSLWGYGGVVRAPDGTIWKVSPRRRRTPVPPPRRSTRSCSCSEDADVAASKRVYAGHGLAVAKSFGRKYVEFAAPSSPVKLALYGHRPRTPVSLRTAPDHTGSRSAATPGPSPTRTGSRGRPRRSIVRVTSSPASGQHLRDLARLRRVRDRIDREYARPLDVEALARGVHMSAGHLSREFRLAYGESPYSYLMTRRIERAMALLRRGDLSVTDVCFEVGCSSLGTFSTRFTELVGVPPSIYRRDAARATAGMPSCVAKQVTRPIRNREAPVSGPRLA